MPGERYQLLLAHLNARSASGELALGAGSDLDILLTALAHVGVTVERIRELQDVVIRSASVDDGHSLDDAAARCWYTRATSWSLTVNDG